MQRKTQHAIWLRTGSLLLACALVAGCASTPKPSTEGGRDIALQAFTELPVKSDFPYVLTSQLHSLKSQPKLVVAALVNVDMSQENVVFKYTPGAFRVRKDGEVTFAAFDEELALPSIGSLVREFQRRTDRGPIGLFLMLDGVALGTTNVELDDAQEEFLRIFEESLQASNVKYVFLVPQRLLVARKN